MKGDLCEAAFRLSTSSAVRVTTHEQKLERRDYPDHGLMRPVVINGKTYQTITEATRLLKVSTKTVYKMLETGEAQDAPALKRSHKGRPISIRPASPAQRRSGRNVA